MNLTLLFKNQLGSGPAQTLKVVCIFKIFRAQSYLTVAQLFDQMNFTCISVFVIDIVYPVVKDQSSHSN